MWWTDVAFFILLTLLLIALYALWKSCKFEQESSRTTMVSSLLESQVEGSASLMTTPPQQISQQIAPQEIPHTQPDQDIVPVQETTFEGPQSV